jgi:hypothetical protein
MSNQRPIHGAGPGCGDLAAVIGAIPYRMALAGGWIDQPFISQLDPAPPGSMVVVGLEPAFMWMERCGMASGTRKVAMRLWQGSLPARDPAQLVRELYAAENQGKTEPSGSQDMVGLIYPGVNRLDYDIRHEGGIFPAHIESSVDPQIARWLARVIHVLPVGQRPPGYSPLGIKNLDPHWIGRLGQTGRDCYAAILAEDIAALGASMNECMTCWATILPHVLRHPTISLDLAAFLGYYQARYPGAMYSGCGGGYIYVVSEHPVPGSFQVKIRTA